MYKFSILTLSLIILTFKVNAINYHLLLESAKNNHWDKYSTEKLMVLSERKPPEYHKLGLLYLAHDDMKQALEFFKQSSHDDSNYYQAYINYKLLNYEKSLEHINLYLLKTKNSSAYSLLIDIFNDSGETSKLVDVFENIQNLGLYTTVIRYKKALYDLSEGDCQSSIDNFLMVLSESPSSTIVNKPLTQAYRQCKQVEQAKKHLSKNNAGKVINNDPLLVNLYEFGNPAFLLKPKLQKYINDRKHDKALDVAEKLITIQTNDENIWINYGTLLTRKKEYTKAINAFESAYDLNQNNEIALKNLIKVNWNVDKDIANRWISKLLIVNPENMIALRVKGDYLILKEKNEEAIPYYQKILEINPEDTVILMKLTKIYLSENKNNQAINMLENSFKIKQTNVLIANYLARVLIVSHKKNSEVTQRALRIARNIFKIKPDYTNKFALLMALRINKFDDEANKYRDELLAIPLRPTQNKYKSQLDHLVNYTTFKESLNPDWIW